METAPVSSTSTSTLKLPAPSHHEHQSFWVWVMCLTGVDYFSTLGYQPSIAFEAAGIVAPIATIVLVLVTIFGALPVYSHVASRSTEGQGSIAMLERLMRGWTGKVVVLTLLGFAATDFVITKTLSAADAVEHLMHNPIWKEHTPSFMHEWSHDGQRVALTMGMLVLLGASFLRGMKEVVGLAVVIVGVYLLLNTIVIGSGIVYLVGHPDRFTEWLTHLQQGSAHWHIPEGHLPTMGDGWGAVILISILIFPKLALGLSGFETGVAVMPLIKGDDDDTHENPKGRIRNAKKLLLTAALIMSVCLLGSSLVTATLIHPAEMAHGGPAEHRALAFIAHGQSEYHINPLFGDVFGTIFDISTIVILGFAGASAMTGLLSLVPRYLPRYGMAPEWARVTHWLVIAFTAINLFVTWVFNADVSAQGGAYATGVLVLMSSACVATIIDVYRSRAGKNIFLRIPWKYLAIGLVFLYTTGANMFERPDGIKIATCFIAAVLILSFASRISRSTELRFDGFAFVDGTSKFLWDSLKHLEFPVLVPHRPGRRGLNEKELQIRAQHRLPPEVPVVFVEAELGDTSDFGHIPLLEVIETEGKFIIRITRCVSIAHAVAAAALELSVLGKPPEIHFGWSDESPLAASFSFFMFGEGNVPWMVRALINKAQPDVERQPRVVIG
jgi:hypothetical protein